MNPEQWRSIERLAQIPSRRLSSIGELETEHPLASAAIAASRQEIPSISSVMENDEELRLTAILKDRFDQWRQAPDRKQASLDLSSLDARYPAAFGRALAQIGAFPLVKEVNQLNLNGSNLNGVDIDPLLAAATNLTRLQIAGCHLVEFPGNLSASVADLDASNNELSSIAKDLQAIPVLNLTNNRFDHIEDGIVNQAIRGCIPELSGNPLSEADLIALDDIATTARERWHEGKSAEAPIPEEGTSPAAGPSIAAIRRRSFRGSISSLTDLGRRRESRLSLEIPGKTVTSVPGRRLPDNRQKAWCGYPAWSAWSRKEGSDEAAQAVRQIADWVKAGDVDQVLDISGLGLKSLPPDLPETAVRISAKGNQLTHLPPGEASEAAARSYNPTDLLELDLCDNRLETIDEGFLDIWLTDCNVMIDGNPIPAGDRERDILKQMRATKNEKWTGRRKVTEGHSVLDVPALSEEPESEPDLLSGALPMTRSPLSRRFHLGRTRAGGGDAAGENTNVPLPQASSSKGSLLGLQRRRSQAGSVASQTASPTEHSRPTSPEGSPSGDRREGERRPTSPAPLRSRFSFLRNRHSSMSEETLVGGASPTASGSGPRSEPGSGSGGMEASTGPVQDIGGSRNEAWKGYAAWSRWERDKGAGGDEKRTETVDRIVRWIVQGTLNELLDLSGLGLASLPPELPKHLVRLDFSGNKASAAATDKGARPQHVFEPPPRLRMLSINGNGLKSLPHIAGLRELSADNNEIESINHDWGNLIRKVSLRNNRLNSVDALTAPPLEELDVAGNNIRTVSDHLVSLLVSGCKVTIADNPLSGDEYARIAALSDAAKAPELRDYQRRKLKLLRPDMTDGAEAFFANLEAMKSDLKSANFSERSGESPPNEQENKKIYNIEINQINSIMEKFLNTELKATGNYIENLKSAQTNLKNGIDAAETYSDSEDFGIDTFKKLVKTVMSRHGTVSVIHGQAQSFMKNIPSLEQMEKHLPDLDRERLSKLHEDWKECSDIDLLPKVSELQETIRDLERGEKEEKRRAKETKITPPA
jgi:Leucine-rich repeat (LRR) protein